jgi:hypothetical protein
LIIVSAIQNSVSIYKKIIIIKEGWKKKEVFIVDYVNCTIIKGEFVENFYETHSEQ